MRLNNIINIGRSLLNDKRVCQALAYTSEKGIISTSDINYKTVNNFIEDLSSQDALITSIALMDLGGNLYFANNLSYGTYDFFTYSKNNNYENEYWVKEAKEEKGLEIFYGKPVLVGTDKKNNQISIVKYLINPSNSKPMGYMVIQLSEQILKKSFSISDSFYESDEIMVLDLNRENSVVYYTGSEEDTSVIYESFLNMDTKKYLFSEYKKKATDWKIVHSVDKSELSKDSKLIQTFMISISLLLVIFSITMSNMISNRITMPLNKLENVIEQVGDGKRNIDVVFDDSEVGKIGQKFKDMVENNLELSENLLASRLNEREAELLLLQSQINPHFLYNTLDSLYFMAILEDNEKLANMILALSDNFKLSLNNGEKYCYISDVILKIEKYMTIQNMRFNNRFKLIIDVEPELLTKKMLNFIIQPFVENAILHGLEPQVGEGEILIKGYLKDDIIYFEIIDNGVGIKEEDFHLLYEGYGIRNVCERVSLTYGNDEKYGIKITSEVSCGTKVIVAIPLMV